MDYYSLLEQEIQRLKEDLVALVDHPTLTSEVEAMAVFDRINEAKEIMGEVKLGQTGRAKDFLADE